MAFTKPVKKEVEKPVAEVKEPPKESPKEPCCLTPVDGKLCGNPLAPGQSEVCAEHVRRG